MKNIIYILSILFITSCASSPQECETKANGFIDGIEGQVTMGEDSSVEVFKQIDKAWAEFDYEALKTFVAVGAEMRFADGRVGVGPDEFIEIIKEPNIELVKIIKDYKKRIYEKEKLDTLEKTFKKSFKEYFSFE